MFMMFSGAVALRTSCDQKRRQPFLLKARSPGVQLGCAWTESKAGGLSPEPADAQTSVHEHAGPLPLFSLQEAVKRRRKEAGTCLGFWQRVWVLSRGELGRNRIH